ncbi:hypothetical protein LSAT2_019887 [Lamellibrachia satsuma]|nr:hypothetical protein LSAT2_019887 [Lamellibrachia satsuma]
MRVTFKICTCMYKILHGLAPDYLNCAVARNASTRALQSASDTTLLAVTVPRRTVGSHTTLHDLLYKLSVDGVIVFDEMTMNGRSC